MYITKPSGGCLSRPWCALACEREWCLLVRFPLWCEVTWSDLHGGESSSSPLRLRLRLRLCSPCFPLPPPPFSPRRRRVAEDPPLWQASGRALSELFVVGRQVVAVVRPYTCSGGGGGAAEMGFPVGYSEVLLPRMFLHLIFLLGHVRRLISWFFEAVGLGDLLLDSDFSPSAADLPPSSEYHRGHHHQYRAGGAFRSASAMLIQEMLPVARVGELRAEGWDLPDACAVCLHELEAGDEARRLGNCRHVFHRCCLDRWTEHDQGTCPLCRTPLVPDDMRDAFDQRLWAAAGVPDASYFLYSSYYDGDGGDADGLEYTAGAEQYESAALDVLHRPSPLLTASAW